METDKTMQIEVKEMTNNDDGVLRYQALNYEGVIVTGPLHQGTDKQGYKYYKTIENDLYYGYITVECEQHYNGRYVLTAYTDLRGRTVRLFEQHHAPRPNLYIEQNQALSVTKRAIEYLTNYEKSDWLSKKPIIDKQILKYTAYKDRSFTHNKSQYIDICSNYVPCVLCRNPVGNTLFKIV
jgi:hypothetical protein